MAGLDFLPDVLSEVTTEPAVAFEASKPATERTAGNLPAIPRLTFRRPEPLDRGPQLAGIRIKTERNERLTRADRVSTWADHMVTEIEPLLKAGKFGTAIRRLADALAGSSIAERELIDGLQDRLTALEAAARRA